MGKSEEADGSVRSRVLQVLSLFTRVKSLWTVEEVATALDVSASSAYRYVQELTASGFLDKVRGGYGLGPALVEFDYLIRRHDPLIQAAIPVMRALLDATSQGATVILCRRYRDHVLCVHRERGSLPHQMGSYERGVSMPLFRGASSRVILANLADRVQRRTYAENEAAIQASGGMTTWKEFAAATARIRRDGYAESRSEVTPGLRGVAAPVFHEKRLLAALSLVTDEGSPLSDLMMRTAVTAAARRLSEEIASAEVLVAR